MAKVLITLLGTGRQAKDEESSKYEVTDYKIENKVYKNLTFLSNAIIQHKNIEKVFFIGTNKSMWDNIAETFKSDDDYMDINLILLYSIERKFWEIYFKQINRIRNNIAHQLETTKQPKDDISNFKKYFDESRKYLKELL